MKIIGSTTHHGPAFPATPEQIRFGEEVGTYAQEHFAPVAARWDRENRFPTENFRVMHERGWLRIPVSRRFGGYGHGIHEDPIAWTFLIHRLSKACGNTGQTFQIWGHCISMVEELASPEQAARFARESLDGAVWCSGGSEPANYSQKRPDPITSRTTVAQQVAGGVRVSGRKLFISNSSAADRFFIFADLRGPDGASRGLVHPVIRRGAPGLKVEANWDAMGMRGTASDDLVLEDVFVPKEDVIGLERPNAYFSSILAGSFLVGRAAVYMGIADAAFEYAARYIRDRMKSGDDMVMRYRIGELESVRQGASSILYRAAWLWQEAIAGRVEKSEAAAFATLAHTEISLAALRITSDALELCGGRGMLRNAPLERYHRDVRAYTVSPPTRNTTMMNVGARVLAPEIVQPSVVGEGV